MPKVYNGTKIEPGFELKLSKDPWSIHNIGDLVIRIKPPVALGASSITLHRRAGGRGGSIRRTYNATNTPSLASLAGKNCAGQWTLWIQDAAAEDVGKLISLG